MPAPIKNDWKLPPTIIPSHTFLPIGIIGSEPIYIEEKKQDNKNDITRFEAFEILSNKEKYENMRKYTRMCNSVNSGKPCRHGVNCRFAHRVEDLVIGDCFFGENCKYVTKQNNNYVSVCAKICNNKHPGETITNFYTRTGLPKPTIHNRKPNFSHILDKKYERNKINNVYYVNSQDALELTRLSIQAGIKNINVNII